LQRTRSGCAAPREFAPPIYFRDRALLVPALPISPTPITHQQEFHMLTIGDKFPDFNLTAVVNNDLNSAFVNTTNASYAGKWMCVFFYPKDFTFVCPTEIVAFGNLDKQFSERDCQILAASIDSEFVHLAWRRDHKDLNSLPIPMLSDIKRELSTALGILDKNAGVAMRATFLVDPDGIIRFVDVTDLNVGRNPQEVLRVLDALQTDELCPCNWKQGEDVIKLG
jgi:peroxiredoxin (alkyl hydroperoxide reductase subunit C)